DGPGRLPGQFARPRKLHALPHDRREFLRRLSIRRVCQLRLAVRERTSLLDGAVAAGSDEERYRRPVLPGAPEYRRGIQERLVRRDLRRFGQELRIKRPPRGRGGVLVLDPVVGPAQGQVRGGAFGKERRPALLVIRVREQAAELL